MTAAINLKYSWLDKRRGNIRLIGTYRLDDDTVDPCMVLIRADEHPKAGRKPCVVTLDAAYLWHEDPDVAGNQLFAETSVLFTEALGLDPMRPHDIFRVQSIIRDHLGDLIAAPRPQGIQQRAIADVQVKFRDGAAPDIEREVRRYV